MSIKIVYIRDRFIFQSKCCIFIAMRFEKQREKYRIRVQY